ncbi:MAG: lysophospholipid acyltransferase family protein [Chloroflexota bacterium]|nr:lysophospholipid acyltransferase family protein [Chloroflexota bacterium]MDE3192523.1 lysophospholipid acyltransferase family protein [Chloroflexota bacterium]
MIAAAISRAVETTVPALPDALDAPVGELVGTLAYLAAPRARAAVRSNLRVVCGRPEIARRVFVAQARHYIETFRVLRLAPARLREMVEVHGWADLASAYDRGKGVVVASAHLGPVVLTGQILAVRGLDVTIVVERKSDEIGRVIDRARSAMGMKTIETRSALGIGRVLRHGGIVGLLADRAVTGVGERVTFFGREALLPSGHVVLALRTGAALFPAFAMREGRRLHAYIGPELEVPRTGEPGADIREGVRRWAAVLERAVARSPEEWSVFERVWS